MPAAEAVSVRHNRAAPTADSRARARLGCGEILRGSSACTWLWTAGRLKRLRERPPHRRRRSGCRRPGAARRRQPGMRWRPSTVSEAVRRGRVAPAEIDAALRPLLRTVRLGRPDPGAALKRRRRAGALPTRRRAREAAVKSKVLLKHSPGAATAGGLCDAFVTGPCAASVDAARHPRPRRRHGHGARGDHRAAPGVRTSSLAAPRRACRHRQHLACELRRRHGVAVGRTSSSRGRTARRSVRCRGRRPDRPGAACCPGGAGPAPCARSCRPPGGGDRWSSAWPSSRSRAGRRCRWPASARRAATPRPTSCSARPTPPAASTAHSTGRWRTAPLRGLPDGGAHLPLLPGRACLPRLPELGYRVVRHSTWCAPAAIPPAGGRGPRHGNQYRSTAATKWSSFIGGAA